MKFIYFKFKMSRQQNQASKDSKDDKHGDLQIEDKNGAKQSKADQMAGEEITMNRIVDFLRD